jgi:hypothetical protein
MPKFSRRHGFAPIEPPITIREDAPDALRSALLDLAVEVGLRPKVLRDVVCRVLFVAPDPRNWSEYPNIWQEVQDLVQQAEWYKVYDIAEALYDKLAQSVAFAEKFKDELNLIFRENGIGWDLTEDDGITFRGGPTFSAATAEAVEVLTATGRDTAASEVREALHDISRRPNPDVSGAIQHVIAALECTARDVLNDSKPTLGKLLPRLDLPKPLDTAMQQLWGYASNNARHVNEGGTIDDAEAELLVSIACAVCVYLAHRQGA